MQHYKLNLTAKRKNIYNLELDLKEKLYKRLPDYVFSNDLFEKWVKQSLTPDTIWIDAGCGANLLVEELEKLSKFGIGIDEVVHPEIKKKEKFLNAGLDNIPLPDDYADLVISNMVIEHIKDIDIVLKELNRILKKGGSLIFRTTNKIYPIQFLGNLIPKKIKDKIIYKLYGVESHDIFGTYYRMNTLKKIKYSLPHSGFEIKYLEAVEDLHLLNKIIFEISFIIYHIQKLKHFYWARNCIVCWAVKKN